MKLKSFLLYILFPVAISPLAMADVIDESLNVCKLEIKEIVKEGTVTVSGLNSLEKAKIKATNECKNAQDSFEPKLVTDCAVMNCKSKLTKSQCDWNLALVKIPNKPKFKITNSSVPIEKPDYRYDQLSFAELLPNGTIGYLWNSFNFENISLEGQFIFSSKNIRRNSYLPQDSNYFILSNGNFVSPQTNGRRSEFLVISPQGVIANKFNFPNEAVLGLTPLPNQQGFAVLTIQDFALTNINKTKTFVSFFDENGALLKKIDLGTKFVDGNTTGELLTGFENNEVLALDSKHSTLYRVDLSGVIEEKKLDLQIAYEIWESRGFWLIENFRTVNAIYFTFRHEETKHSGTFVLKKDLQFSFFNFPSPYQRTGVLPASSNVFGPILTFNSDHNVNSICYSNGESIHESKIEPLEASVFRFDPKGNNIQHLRIQNVSCGENGVIYMDADHPLFQSKNGFVLAGMAGVLLEKDLFTNMPKYSSHTNFVKLSGNEFGFVQAIHQDQGNSANLVKIKIERDGCEYIAKIKPSKS